ncbi:MAG: hypothetical protein IKR45_03320 [Treponema sp.]|nr:hypothetical protein [Treponema sp.]
MIKKTLFVLAGALLFLFTSCENFMSGSDVKDQLEKQIAYSNAKSFILIISQDTTMGSFLSSGEKECKVGYSITVQFNVKKDAYIFKGLKAVNASDTDLSMDDCVEFQVTDHDDQKGIYKVSIKLLKEATDILIVPDCVEMPAIIAEECKPDMSKDWDQDSTIRIVFNKPVTATQYFVPAITDASGQNLADYFGEPYFSADSTMLLIPTNKNLRLVDPEGNISSKDIIVSIDLTNIIDEEGYSGNGTVLHKYRVGKTFDTVIPVINEITVYSTSDVNNKYYKELTTTAFASWATGTAANNFGDFGKNRVSNSVYIEFEGSDEGSGIGGANVKETHYKYTDGSAANLVTGSFFVPAKINELTGKYYIDYEMNTPGDGIILLDVYAQDNAGNNSSTYKSVYIVKDNSIDSGTIKFKYENEAVATTNNNIPVDPNNPNNQQISESYEELVQRIDNLYTDNADGTQTITLSFKETAVDTFYQGCSSPYELSVFWSYDSNDDKSFTAAAKNGNTYSIKRDPNKIVFLKVNCKDTVGNERIVSKIIPPALEIQLIYDGDNSQYLYGPANLLSYLAMCIDQANQQNSGGAGVKFLLNYDFYTLNESNYEKQNYNSITEMTETISARFDDILSDYTTWYINATATHIAGEDLLVVIQPKGTFNGFAIADFGNFPGPRSVNKIEASITSWKYFDTQNYPESQEAFRSSFPDTDSYGGKILHGPKSKPSDPPYWTDGYNAAGEYAFAMYGKDLGLSNEASSDSNNDISEYDLVLGFSTEDKIIPIKEQIKIEVTPIKNVGVYKISLADYINTAYPGYDKVTYYFFLEPMNVFGDGNSTTIQFVDGYSQRESSPTLFLSTDNPAQCKYTIRIEAYDDAKQKYYVPVLQIPILEGLMPGGEGESVDNPRNAFRNIIRDNNLTITLEGGEEKTAENASDNEINTFFNTLKAQNGLINYIENNFKLKDYKTLKFEGNTKAVSGESDAYQSYPGFKDSSGNVILYSCNLDVTPPDINSQTSGMSLPILEGSYLIIASPSDANPKYIDSNNEKAELSYYIIPSQSNDYKLTSVYSQEELETSFAKYKHTLTYYPNGDTVVIPFENTKPGMNVVYIVAEDAYGNSALAYYPVMTTSLGKLPVQKKQTQFEETVSYTVTTLNPETGEETQTPQTDTYNYSAWEVTLDFRKRNDLLAAGQLPEDLCVELQYLNSEYFNDNRIYFWRSPDPNEIFNAVNFIDSESTQPGEPRPYKVLTTDNPLVFKTVYKLPQGMGGDISRWGRIRAYIKNEGQNVAVKEKGHLYYEYIYTGEYSANCSTKNCIEGLNGYLVYSDKPVLAHTMFSKEKLTSSIYDEDARLIWENEGADTGIQLVNNDAYDINSPTVIMMGYYTNDNLKVIPKGYYYTTIFHFADGTVIMSDIKQKH